MIIRHIIQIRIAWALAIGCSTLFAHADLEEDYQSLWKAYRGALEAAEERHMEEAETFEDNCVNALESMMAAFREEGNLTYWLEAKNYIDTIRAGEVDSVDADKFQCGDMRSFHSKFLEARGNLAGKGRADQFRIMDMMCGKLGEFEQNFTREGKIDLAVKAREAAESIREKPVYKLAQTESAPQFPTVAAGPSRPAYRPPAAVPTPPMTMAQRAAAAAPDAMIEVDVSKKNLSKLARNGDYDDKVQNILFLVNIQSRELMRDYEKLSVKLWGFGRSVHSKSQYKMILVDTMNVDGLPRGRSVEVETKQVRNLYDNNAYAKYGYKFYGYVLEIKDSKGDLIFRKVSPSRLEGDADKIKSTSENMTFTL